MLEFIEKVREELPVDDSAHEGEHIFLYGLIRSIRPKVVLETGTHRGLSSLYMAHALYDNGEGVLHTVDPSDWGAQGNFRKFAELDKITTVHLARGDEVKIDEKVDFFFCDGLHEYEEVEKEMAHIFPMLSDHAVVAFHDAGGDNVAVGVRQAVLDRGLQAILLPTYNNIILYSKASYDNVKNYSKDKERWSE